MAEPVEMADMTVEEIMTLFGVDRAKAEFMLAVARGEIDGDIEVIDEEPA